MGKMCVFFALKKKQKALKKQLMWVVVGLGRKLGGLGAFDNYPYIFDFLVVFHNWSENVNLCGPLFFQESKCRCCLRKGKDTEAWASFCLRVSVLIHILLSQSGTPG